MYIPQEIIRKKRDGSPLSNSEIEFMINGYVNNTIPDYQISALAMAIFLQGFNTEETTSLLNSMINTGIKFDWSNYKPSRIFVDKHSTGGVGDKTSLIILPLLVADGLDVPMISGRGLGHTGGTLDKLESIPGFKTRIDNDTIMNLIKKHHCAFGAQTDEFVPADKKLYALRDVTGTVESRALITASIMSKKLAEGLDGLILDVKFGSGAFMQEYSKAKELAESLVNVGKKAGCSCIAALTNMDEPLGTNAGNSLEVDECLDILQGIEGNDDTKELSLWLAAGAACAARKNSSQEALQDSYNRMKSYLTSGVAFDIFIKIAVAQGAKSQDLERKNTNWITGNVAVKPIYADSKGYIHSINTRNLGIGILELGGGRKKTTDIINPFVGISKIKKVGQECSKTEPICFLHYQTNQDTKHIENFIKNSFNISQNTSEINKLPLIKEWLF